MAKEVKVVIHPKGVVDLRHLGKVTTISNKVSHYDEDGATNGGAITFQAIDTKGNVYINSISVFTLKEILKETGN